ncbi:mechanosensitive ion channel family protein [Haloprofundus salilacus]|uniref:mechanosensitive ion channel family protein n=1 Tax=Haloprofundus salilacus TaxID=2876190 RepID=UPI001CCA172A|nr:hypothetical protein [Haloprofundus salilacus]
MSKTNIGTCNDNEYTTNAALVPLFVVLQFGIPDFLQETISTIIAFIPRLIGAAIILLIGWIIGRVVARVVSAIVDRSELDEMVLRTPVGRALGNSEQAVSNTFGKLAAWYVYLLAILAAANALAITVLSQWITTAVSYLPAFIAGLAVIILGFVVADFIARVVRQSSATSQGGVSTILADGVRMFLYFTVLVIGLDTMGFNVQVLYILARAVAYGIGAAIAIGLGLAIGLGARGWVGENIDQWASQSKRAAPSMNDQSQQPSSDD